MIFIVVEEKRPIIALDKLLNPTVNCSSGSQMSSLTIMIGAHSTVDEEPTGNLLKVKDIHFIFLLFFSR